MWTGFSPPPSRIYDRSMSVAPKMLYAKQIDTNCICKNCPQNSYQLEIRFCYLVGTMWRKPLHMDRNHQTSPRYFVAPVYRGLESSWKIKSCACRARHL